jgi:hypothetical protein
MPLVISHHLLNVFVHLANKRGFKKKKQMVHVWQPFAKQPLSKLSMWEGDIKTD